MNAANAAWSPITPLAELAVALPDASRVFHRHGLDYCCGGRRPLADACQQKGLDPQAVLDEIHAQAPGAEAPRWDARPIPELIDYIVAYYHARLRDELPQLLALAAKVETRHADKSSRPAGLTEHLRELSDEIHPHMMKEEQVLFPAYLRGWGPRALMPTRAMEAEHREVARLLQKTRDLTTNLVPPAEACTSWRALYLRLSALEAELMEHIHLENNVLFARALGA